MLNRFIMALSFITTVPIKYKGEWDEEEFSKSVVFYPLIALMIGLIVGGSMYYISRYNLNMSGVIGILLWILVTGGLHLDGYMDSCDGLLSRRGRDKSLEIMKDSRVGSFSVIGIILLIITKLFLYIWIIGYYSFPIYVIVLGFSFSRLMQILAIISYPSARSEGLGVMVQKYANKSYIVPGVAGVVLVLILAAIQSGLNTFLLLFIPLILAGVIIYYYLGKISNYLGGLTGDIYGAVAEIGEVIYLLMLFVCSFVVWILV